MKKGQRLDGEILRMRLREDTIHGTFERTVKYLLETHGALSTKEIHPFVQAIHPDLCDNDVDRVIAGKHFGKKWKHAVRTAQGKLRIKKIIKLESGKWMLIKK